MKWEYFVKDIGANFNPPKGQTEILNHYGEQGWELVVVLSVEQGEFAYFKRPIKEEIPVYKDGVRLEKSRMYAIGKYSYDSVQDGYVIFAPDRRKLSGLDVERLLNKEGV